MRAVTGLVEINGTLQYTVDNRVCKIQRVLHIDDYNSMQRKQQQNNSYPNIKLKAVFTEPVFFCTDAATICFCGYAGQTRSKTKNNFHCTWETCNRTWGYAGVYKENWYSCVRVSQFVCVHNYDVCPRRPVFGRRFNNKAHFIDSSKPP